METLNKVTNSIVYTVKFKCTSHTDDVNNNKCQFADLPEHERGRPFSINVMRLHLYKWWASFYDEDAKILLSDFRDVFFQTDPFVYMPESWKDHQLAVFEEPFPNIMIYRNGWNGAWIQDCFGEVGYNKVAYNVVSCSGTVMGTRNGILAYVSSAVAVE